jgi:hypothetical protein
MEPLDKWKDGYKEYFASLDPATGTYNLYTTDWKTVKYSWTTWESIQNEKEEKTPTLNESRLKEIKP